MALFPFVLWIGSNWFSIACRFLVGFGDLVGLFYFVTLFVMDSISPVLFKETQARIESLFGCALDPDAVETLQDVLQTVYSVGFGHGQTDGMNISARQRGAC
jgi:hypothetical protein